MLDWESSKNEILLNPRFPKSQGEALLSALSGCLDQFQSHVFLMSSGTTGLSEESLKWVALSKQAILASAAAVNRHLESHSSSQDIWVQSLPDFHVGGLGVWARSYLSGAQVLRQLVWNPQEFVALTQSHRASLAALVPAQIYDLVQAGLSAPASMRAVLVGGGFFSETVFNKARALGWPVLPTYGMTEACSQIATAPLGFERYQTCQQGRFPKLQRLPHLQVRMSEDQTIEVKGESLFTTYIYQKEGRPVLSDPKTVEGWYRTQDRAIGMDSTSFIVLGRVTEFIKIGGESVELSYLRSILEEVKLTCLSIGAAEATEGAKGVDLDLHAIPDDRLGHIIGLVADQNLSTEAAQMLIQKFNEKVLPFERIRKFQSFVKLPRTALGKLISAQLNHHCQSTDTHGG